MCVFRLLNKGRRHGGFLISSSIYGRRGLAYSLGVYLVSALKWFTLKNRLKMAFIFSICNLRVVFDLGPLSGQYLMWIRDQWRGNIKFQA